jgi:hypothetical protein
MNNNKMNEVYWVWIIPNLQEVLIEDIGTPPVGTSEYKTFTDWFEALKYGNTKAKELGYYVEIDNWVGRMYENEENN